MTVFEFTKFGIFMYSALLLVFGASIPILLSVFKQDIPKEPSEFREEYVKIC